MLYPYHDIGLDGLFSANREIKLPTGEKCKYIFMLTKMHLARQISIGILWGACTGDHRWIPLTMRQLCGDDIEPVSLLEVWALIQYKDHILPV